ncbi:MAG: hypothetical protein IJN05_05065 [Ruminococcus sp.]|nr:hypothetical protein [Ruminococcus sp.]MBR3996341.1 hypothetical protein [Clostridia bacterium]
MKKIISFVGIITIMLSITFTAFAGDIPEALGYEDEAQIFIGTLKDFKIDNSSSPKVQDVQVLPTRKIKGEVPINELQIYEECYFETAIPEKDKEYLFGWLGDNSVWVYAIESYNDKEIKLKINGDEFAERIQDSLDSGLYARLEHERATLGTQISFAEFLFAKPLTSSNVKKVTLRYQDELHEVDVDEFEKVAKEIMIANAKNSALYESGKEDAYKTVLYIELLDENEQLVSMAAVSRFGEVDRYGLMMSRLMQKDYEMKTKDLQKLYSLFPKDIQKNIVAPEEIQSSEDPLEVPAIPEKNYAPWLYGGAATIFVIAFIIGFAIKRKRG